MARRRGQWIKHQDRIDPRRLVKAPYSYWKTTTFLAALRHDRLDAPWLLNGPINGDSFRVYVEQELVPTLGPGDIVVMDNLGSHKAKAVRQAIRKAGAKLFFLPTYSPARINRAGVRQAE